MLELALIVGGVALVSSLIAQGANDEEAAKAIKDYAQQYKPEALAAIDEYVSRRPEMAQVFAEQQAPEAVAAQKSALARLQQISEKGYTPEEQAALNKIQQQTAAQASQQQAALRSQMAQRGAAGSGAELAMNLAGLGQQSAQQYQAGLDVAAQAQRRALQGLQGVGSMAGQMREQGFGEAARRAQAADEVARIGGQWKQDALRTGYEVQSGAAKTSRELENEKWKKLGELGTGALKAGSGSDWLK